MRDRPLCYGEPKIHGSNLTSQKCATLLVRYESLQSESWSLIRVFLCPVVLFTSLGTEPLRASGFILPHDLGYAGERTKLDPAGLQLIIEHGVSDEELERAVEGIDADKFLMVIDACNSGQALEAAEQRRGPMNSRGLAQLAYEKGMYIRPRRRVIKRRRRHHNLGMVSDLRARRGRIEAGGGGQ